MPRRKEYVEAEVLDPAMNLFWTNGYSNTTARMLEKAMKINLFSIYSSFRNKEGVLLECLKTYKKINQDQLLSKLKQGSTIADIKQYFQDFLLFTKDAGTYRGCLLINTAQEQGYQTNSLAKKEIDVFAAEIMKSIKSILSRKIDSNKELEKTTNYLFVSLLGLITTAKSLDEQQIKDYLDMTFKGL